MYVYSCQLLAINTSDSTPRLATYDSTGPVDYIDVFNDAGDAYGELTVAAGARVDRKLVDGTARTGYSLIKSKARTAQAMASEYYQFDWEYAQTPEESSWIASSWVGVGIPCLRTPVDSLAVRSLEHMEQTWSHEIQRLPLTLINL